MASINGVFDDDPVAPGSFSELLFADEITGLETDNGCFDFTSSFASSQDNNIKNTPKMLCFGDYANKQSCDVKVVVENNAAKTGRIPGVISMDSSTSNTKISTLTKPRKKRYGSGTEPVRDQTGFSGDHSGSKRNGKKFKPDNSSATGHAKVAKKEKLGERITALQQLVSPFGKTDTTSVLHEALGYIRFLQDQVQVLCSPYLQPLNPSEDGGESDKRKDDDLRSRGLCLVPVDLTLHVADSNGADLWSSTAMPSG